MQKKIEQMNGHYIVCGAGLVGSNVADDLELTGRPFVIIDSDMKDIQHYLETHPAQPYLHGETTDNDVLLAAGSCEPRAYSPWHMTTVSTWSSA